MQALHPPSFFNHYIGYRFPLAGNFYTHPCMHERIFAFFPSKWLLFRITLKHAAFKSGSFSFAVLRSFLEKRALRTLWDTFFPFEKLIYSCISMQRRMNLVPCRGRSQSISLKISFLRSFQDRIIFSNLFLGCSCYSKPSYSIGSSPSPFCSIMIFEKSTFFFSSWSLFNRWCEFST